MRLVIVRPGLKCAAYEKVSGSVGLLCFAPIFAFSESESNPILIFRGISVSQPLRFRSVLFPMVMVYERESRAGSSSIKNPSIPIGRVNCMCPARGIRIREVRGSGCRYWKRP